LGGLLQKEDGVGWGGTLRTGDLNEDGAGLNSLSNRKSTKYFSFDLFNARQYPQYGLSAYASVGWESLDVVGGSKDDGLSAFLSVTRTY
jgi:hypothetical protein